MFVHREIERSFQAWGRFVCLRPWTILGTCLLFIAVCATGLPQLRLANSMESLLHPGDPSRVRYDAFRETFGEDQRLVVALTPPEIFDQEFLKRLERLQRDLEENVPHIAEVTSLVNVRFLRGNEQELIVGKLMEEWPQTEEDLQRLRVRAMAHPQYRNTILSEDADVAALILKPGRRSPSTPEAEALAGFDPAAPEFPHGEELLASESAEALTGLEISELMIGLDTVVARHATEASPIHVTGTPVLNHRVNQAMARDLLLVGPLALLLAAVILGLLFRRASAVILTLSVVVAALFSAIGLMGLLDIPASVVSEVLPALLITIGVCDSVHILSAIDRELRSGRERAEAIPAALGHAGLANLMTSVTTAAGLASFAGAELAPVSDLGVAAPLGVMLAFLSTVTLLPASLAVFPLDSGREAAIAGERARSRGPS